MKNDNLNISIEIGSYHISFLKFSCECLHSNIPVHAHSTNSYEIHYISKGRGTLISGKKSYALYPGVLCTTGPNIEHAQFLDRQDPMHEYCIYLKVKHRSRDNSDLDDIMKLFLNHPFWYGPDCTHLGVVLEQILNEFLNPGAAVDLILEALFKQFMVCMVRNYNHTIHASVMSDPVPLVKANILIEDSFLYEYATITLKELAARLGLSTRQTSRILYSRYGQSFSEKKNEARMAAADTYLRENQLTISEISEKLGYSCVSHFHTAFRRYYNDTASHYRERLLSHGEEPN